MAGVVLLARESGRAGRATAALGWAATLLLLADPALIGDAGFQLSSLATAGLIAWATPLTEWIDASARGRLPGWSAESLGVSLAAQAATLPIILVSFGRLAILSPVVNLVVVPLVAPAMAAGLVALGGGVAVVRRARRRSSGRSSAAPGWVDPAAARRRSSRRRPACRSRASPSSRRSTRRRLCVATRRRGRGALVASTPDRGGAATIAAGACDPVRRPAPARSPDRARTSAGRPARRPAASRGGLVVAAARRRRRRRRAAARASPGSRSSTSGRAMRSSSRARAAAGC